jgi:hypothetical protein
LQGKQLLFTKTLNNNMSLSAFFIQKDELYLYDLLSGKQLKKFDIDIGTILSMSTKKKYDFVIELL